MASVSCIRVRCPSIFTAAVPAVSWRPPASARAEGSGRAMGGAFEGDWSETDPACSPLTVPFCGQAALSQQTERSDNTVRHAKRSVVFWASCLPASSTFFYSGLSPHAVGGVPCSNPQSPRMVRIHPPPPRPTPIPATYFTGACAVAPTADKAPTHPSSTVALRLSIAASSSLDPPHLTDTATFLATTHPHSLKLPTHHNRRGGGLCAQSPPSHRSSGLSVCLLVSPGLDPPKVGPSGYTHESSAKHTLNTSS